MTSIHRAMEREKKGDELDLKARLYPKKWHIKCVDMSFLCSISIITFIVTEADRLNNLKLAQPVPNTLSFNCYEGRPSQSDP